MDHQNILITGGGTGGHLMPGLALYETLGNLTSPGSVKFLCTGREFDRHILSEQEVKYVTVNSPTWPGINFELPGFVGDFSLSFIKALSKIRQWDPGVVVALGGFGSAPAGLAAYARGIPLVVLDQNVIPGKAARVLSRLSDLFVLQWEKSQKHVSSPERARVLGNPLRSQIRTAPDKGEARDILKVPTDRSVLLVMGGSQGARAINNWLVESIEEIDHAGENLFVIHIAGSEDEHRIRSVYRDLSISSRVVGFTNRIHLFYSAADLVLSRAGGTTIAELTHLKKPAVFIPYPYATEDHQLKNAREIERRGGGLVLREDRLNQRAFKDVVMDTLFSQDRLRQMKTHLEEIRKPDATRKVSEKILELAQKGNG